MAKFKLRTDDRAWIKRNNGVVDADGRVTIDVPANQLGTDAFAGREWVTYTLPDCPKDYPNPHTMCLKSWLEA